MPVIGKLYKFYLDGKQNALEMIRFNLQDYFNCCVYFCPFDSKNIFIRDLVLEDDYIPVLMFLGICERHNQTVYKFLNGTKIIFILKDFFESENDEFNLDELEEITT